jgi:hypothetical protein
LEPREIKERNSKSEKVLGEKGVAYSSQSKKMRVFALAKL